jgi:periplasmic protein CpxP/Spy
MFNTGATAPKDCTMKTWIKRSLVGVLGATFLLVGIGAWAHRDGGSAWGPMGGGDSTQMRDRMVDRVSSKLSLDAAQKAKLTALAEAMHTQRSALMGDGEPRAQMQSLIAGASFDRARASALMANKIAALQSGSPAVITAMADFYDGLNPAQQTQVREFMASRGGHGSHGMGRHGMMGGERGERH